MISNGKMKCGVWNSSLIVMVSIFTTIFLLKSKRTNDKSRARSETRGIGSDKIYNLKLNMNEK